MEIGRQIKERRKELGLTQEELASLLGVSRTAVSNWEGGRNYPDIELITLLSETLHIPVHLLLCNGRIINDQMTMDQEKISEKKNRNFFIPYKLAFPVLTACLFFALFKVTKYSDLSDPTQIKSLVMTEQGMLIQTDLPMYKSLAGYMTNLKPEGSVMEVSLVEKTDLSMKNTNEVLIEYDQTFKSDKISAVEICYRDDVIKSFQFDN